MTRIVTDSCCDLSQELIDRFNIDVVPLGVFINDITYHDGIDIHTVDLFREVEKSGALPKTSAPSVATFANHFQGPEDTIYIGISSNLSASHQNAILAKELLKKENLFILDSLNLSTGIGLLVLAAAEMAASGMKASDIAVQIPILSANVHTSFVIDTLNYLHKGGRCSGTELLIGSLLKIRPVIEVRKDGSLGVQKKISGSRKKALDSMVEDFKSNLANVSRHRIFITHTLCDADASYIKEEITKLDSFDEICITVAGSTIASHCGPNTIGILYLTK
jgi:DegV family protein with EDD domain